MKIKTYIRWEQLRGKPFGKFNPLDEEDYIALLYVRALERGSATGYTLEEFRRTIRVPHINNRQREECERDLAILSQFVRKNGAEGKDVDSDPEYFGKLAARLVAEGMGAHFVMEELEMPDIEAFLKGYEERRRERMEESRLWTYLSVQPHCKPMRRGPMDLYPFPWDEHKEEKPIQPEEIKAFEAFMQNGSRIEHDKN